MFRLYVLLCCFMVINGQQIITEESHPAPEPYNFAFSASNEDGSSSSREEIGDASGTVTGFYTIVGLDGQERRVDYIADENGFRAKVTTNEIGTESKDAADAEYLSSAPSTDQLRAEWLASQSVQQGVKTKVNTQQTLIGSQAILPPSKVAIKSQTVSSGGLGVSLVGAAPSVGGSVFTRTKSVKTSGNVNVVRVAQPVQQITRTVQTETNNGFGSDGGLSVVSLPQPGQQITRTVQKQTSSGFGSDGGLSVVSLPQPGQQITRTVQKQTSSGFGSDGGLSFVNLPQPGQQITRTVQTQTSSGFGSDGGLSFVNIGSQVPSRVVTGGGYSIGGIASPAGSSRVSTIQTQQLGTKGGGLSIVGLSPSSRGIARTQAFRTQTIGSSPTISLSPQDISSLLAQQNNGLQGLQGLSLSGLQVIPAGNQLVRYLTNGNGEAQQLQGYNNQGNIILLPGDLNLDAIQSQNS